MIMLIYQYLRWIIGRMRVRLVGSVLAPSLPVGVAVAATTGTLALLCGMAEIGATRATLTALEPVD
jgi:hypothetical protein